MFSIKKAFCFVIISGFFLEIFITTFEELQMHNFLSGTLKITQIRHLAQFEKESIYRE